VLRAPRVHVALCDFDCLSPRGNVRLNGRIVLVIRWAALKEVNGDPWVQHQVEAYVKIDSRGWRTVAKTMRPVVEKYMEDQVQEAGWFLSLMGRLVETHPNWAVQVVQNQAQFPAETRQGLRELILASRRADANPGRPQVVENAPTS